MDGRIGKSINECIIGLSNLVWHYSALYTPPPVLVGSTWTPGTPHGVYVESM
jgi:hypothetical protein